MPAPYSYDLRVKVMSALDSGLTKTEVVRIFKISRNTLNLWQKRREVSGDYQAKKNSQKGYGAKITDLSKFRDFVSLHGSKTQKEMASHWDGEISDQTIGKALKKINFTRKKKLTVIEKETRRGEGILGQKSS